MVATMPAKHPPDEPGLTAAEAAEALGVSRRTLDRLQADGTLVPHYVRSLRGKRTRKFARADVERLARATTATEGKA